MIEIIINMVRILDLYMSGYKILLALEYYKLVTNLGRI